MAQNFYRFEGKGLSVAQPMASAIAFGGKDIENRSWRTHYRGPLAIHASGTLYKEDFSAIVKQNDKKRTLAEWIRLGQRKYKFDFSDEAAPNSHIVAIAMLADCLEKSKSPWYRGQYAWVLEGVIPIEPIPWTGGLSIWDCKFKYRPLRPRTDF